MLCILGHVNTYVDPKTGQTYDYGVQLFSNISVVTDYFAHFNIPLGPPEASASTVAKSVNFETGSLVPNSALIKGNFTAAILEYAEQQAKFPTIFHSWDIPQPVPEELLIDFGTFLRKYHLGAFAYTAFDYNQGIGNILAQPLLYIFKYFDQQQVHDLLTGGFVGNGHHDNQQLYDRARAELGANAFLSSDVTKVNRNADGVVEVFVTTPGGQKCIKASKLLISIPPKLSNLGFLDLDQQDSSLLGQFNNSYYWDAVLRSTGIPDNTSLNNLNPAAPFNLPAMPGIYGYGSTPISGLHTAYYSSPHPMSNEEVKTDILATLSKLRKALGYSEPEVATHFVGFHNHAPFELTVSTEAIKSGFYKRFEALQGKSNTWWTGATWLNQASSTLWNFTEYEILPKLIASL